MSGELHVLLLGAPLLKRDGVPLTGLTLRKSLALLAYLAVTGRAHGREALTGLLWGEASDANARASLRKVLAELRRQLPVHLIIGRTEVAFDNTPPHQLDVQDFYKRVSSILMLHDGPLSRENAVALEAAVELVRGDFMEGFVVRNAPAFEDWVLLEREYLRQLFLLALEALLGYHATRGTYVQAITLADRLLALEPAHEAAHRTKMSLLARSGQREAALRQYRASREALAALDAEPDGETEALHRRIRAGAEVPATWPMPSHNLPAPLTPLVGREAELSEIEARLGDPACRLLTLIGPGGCGKTALALAAATATLSADFPKIDRSAGETRSASRVLARGRFGRQPSRFGDGVVFVPLSALSDVDALTPAVVHALDMPLSEWEPAMQAHRNWSSARRQLLDFVRRKRLLLVLDGFEHLLADTSLLEDILRAGPEVKILVTSRTRLNVVGECLFLVKGLAFPEAGCEDVAMLASHPAVHLFVSSARRIRADFEATEAILADVACICRLVGGLPLAILLAAGWARILSPDQIVAQLSWDSGRSLDLLETDRDDLPARQRSMRAVFDHSWHLLTEREQQVLGALSVLPRAFDESAAKHVAGASLRELRSLVDQSMLHATSPGAYHLHELLRQYAGEKLEAVPGAAEATRDRYATQFETAWTEGQALAPAPSPEALEQTIACSAEA